MATSRRLVAQTLPIEKENVRFGKAGNLESRPHLQRRALHDQTNKTDVFASKGLSDAKETHTTAKPTFDMAEVGKALESCLNQDLDPGVKNIDEDDYDNPQLCAEYVNEIMKYLKAKEAQFHVKMDYMNSQAEINGKMRTILIDWLLQVHARFQLLQETLYITVSIIDRYLAKNQVSKANLQLVGVGAMLLASKYEEMYAPEVNDFVYITDNAYTKKQIRQIEANIFSKLNYSLGDPIPLHFLRRYSKAGEVDAEKHTMAKYLMEVTLPDYSSLQFLPSEIAAAALCLSLKLLDNSTWTPTLEYYSEYSEKDLKPCMKRMALLVTKRGKAVAVHNKYAQCKFMRISTYKCLKMSLIQEIAQSD